MKWDLKSLITFSLITTLCLISIGVTIATLFNPDGMLEEFKIVFVLFSNATTGVITYFFTKRNNTERSRKTDIQDE